MGKVTVGAVFQAYQIIRRKHDEARDEKRRDYGQTLVATSELGQFLTDCQLEVELPPNIQAMVVPLLVMP